MLRSLKMLVLVLGLALPAFAQEFPAPLGHVNDFANILPDSLKAQLEAELVAFEDSTAHEIAVVTLASLNGDVVKDVAVRLFAEWGIGKAGADNGVLLLYAHDSRDVRIETGYGLEGVLTDAQCSRIIRNIMVPEKQAHGLPAAIAAGTRAIEQTIVTEPPLETVQARRENSDVLIILAVLFALGAVVGLVVWLVVLFVRNQKHSSLRARCTQRLDDLGPTIESARHTFGEIKRRYPHVMLDGYEPSVNGPEFQSVLDAVGGRYRKASMDLLEQLSRNIDNAERRLQAVGQLEGKIRSAREKMPTLVHEAEGTLRRASQLVADNDVRSSTKVELREISTQISELTLRSSRGDQTDWLAVSAFLTILLADLSAEIQTAIRDQRFADRARKEGQTLLEDVKERAEAKNHTAAKAKISEAEERRAAGKGWPRVFQLLLDAKEMLDEQDRADSYTSRQSTDDSSPSFPSIGSIGGSSGGFGGFGGGRSGGGGASGKL